MRNPEPSRRAILTAGAGAALALTLAPSAHAVAPGHRPRDRTFHVARSGHADFTSVRAAVEAVPGDGWTIVLAPGVYRETVDVPATATGLTLLGAHPDPRRTVIVYDNAAGTPKPDGSGTYGTSGSATTTVRADGFTARRVTFANDWLRADHPGVSGTQAVAVKTMGDRSAFYDCRFLGHQDTLYIDTVSRGVFARQYFHGCYVEGDVDFVFGRATAVLEDCHFRTLRRDVDFTPQGMVFAPSTAADNPYGYLADGCRITSTAPAGAYCLARPWVPSSDTTARPMLTVRDTWIGPGIDAVSPYTEMSSGYPWQEQRFAEYRNTGPGAKVPVPANRPRLTRAEAALHTRENYLTGTDDWRPWRAVRPSSRIPRR